MMVTVIPSVWAFEVPEKNLALVDEWIEVLKAHQPEMHDFQKRFSQRRYTAWLQSSSQGHFIVEYAEHIDLSASDAYNKVKEDDSEFAQYLKEWKNRLHENAFDQFKGIRKIIDMTMDGALNPGLISRASIFPIKPGKVAQVVDWCDQAIRNHSEEAIAYRQRMGFCQWRAWIAEFEDQQYLVQHHLLREDFDVICEVYQKDEGDYARLIAQFGIDCLEVDLAKKEDWPNLRLLIDMVNPYLKED